VFRDDEIAIAKTIDIVTYVEIEAATNRGGHISLALNGRRRCWRFECAPVHQGLVSYHHGVCCIDRMCTFACGNLKASQISRRFRICRGMGGR